MKHHRAFIRGLEYSKDVNMFVKWYLFLICTVLINVSDGSDCEDLMSCVSSIFTGTVKDTSGTKPVDRTSVLTSVGNILDELSQLVLDTIKNVTKEITYTKELNDTVIGIQTFTVDDTDKLNETSEKVKVYLLDTLADKNSNITNNVTSLNIGLERNGTYLPPKIHTIVNLAERQTVTENAYLTILNISNIKETAFYNKSEYITTKTPIDEANIPEKYLDGEIASLYLPPVKYEMNVIPLEKSIPNEDDNFKLKIRGSFVKKTYESPINVTYVNIERGGNVSTHVPDDPIVDIHNNINLSFHKIKQQEEITKQSIALNATYVNQNATNTTENFQISSNQARKDHEGIEIKINITERTKHNASNKKNNNLSPTRNTTKEHDNLKGYIPKNNKTKENNIENNNFAVDFEAIPEGDLNQTYQKSDDVRNIEKQNQRENEILFFDDFHYRSDDDNGTDYLEIDYISYFKDVTVEDVGYTPAIYEPSTSAPFSVTEVTRDNGIDSIYPWIATVFIKNEQNDQFMYICDGTLLSKRVVLTAARCLTKENVTEDAANVLVILGKRSLQAMGRYEKVIRVNHIKIHENFTDVENDLALIVLDEVITPNEDIHPVEITNDDSNDDDNNLEDTESATTGWHVTGAIYPIYFEDESTGKCVTRIKNTFCAVFGDSITICPSFGGVFVCRINNQWRLRGISTGVPTSSGVCFSKKVTFTNISYYYNWILDNIDINK